MSNDRGTTELIATELIRMIEPLAHASEDGSSGIIALAREAGLDLNTILEDASLADLNNIASTIQATYNALQALTEGDETDVSQIGNLIRGLVNLFEVLNDLNDLQVVDDVIGELAQIGKRLLDFLIIRYLLNYHPALYSSLLLIGFIDEGRKEEQILPAIHYSYLYQLFQDFGITAREVYAWGTNGFKASLFLIRLQSLLFSLDIPAHLCPIEPGERIPETDRDSYLPDQQLRIPLFVIERDGVPTEFGLSMVPLRPHADHSKGFGIVAFGVLSIAEDFSLDDNWRLEIAASADALVPWGIAIRPEGFSLTGVADSVPPPTVNLHVLVERGSTDDERSLLIGSADASRLELGTVGLKIGFDFSGESNVFLELPVRGLRAVINVSEGDGFLQRIFSEDGIVADFDLVLGVSTAHGFYFKGSAGLEISIPTHLSLGFIEFEALTLGLRITDDGIPISLGATINANLSVLQVAIENMGIEATLVFNDENRGNMGPVDFQIGFKPPNGVGLSIDAGVVKGGGYLFFDFDREEYAGALELTLMEWLALKAIGLITTKMPDGSKGFSLLIIITVEFGSGIQLGFGFTLIGVGGLLGLNRTVNIEPLTEGVRTGAVESVMFPEDVVANAPRIISDLRRFFPPRKDIFLIGPMAKIGWGTPTLLTAQLGVILEFPSVNITILGVIKVVLPDEDADILRLQVNFIGRIEPSNRLLWFYAELFDSRVLFITLEGGMGLLVNWGDNANFVVSVGGFHPRYSPPPLPFPEPPRIAANILNESWARVRIEGYFAVTSNSVQFGARAELYFGVSAFNLEGHLGFDALFQFNPFFFSFSLSFSLSVKVFGIGLFSVGFSGLLEGPTPWYIKGQGKISILFFKISVPFEHTWGESRETTLEPIEVFPLVEQEFNALTNWEAILPNSSNLLVSLRKLGDAETDQLVLHPVGKLRISQRKIPIDFTLDKVGNQRPADVRRVLVDAAIPGGGSVSVTERQEKFAIGQFKDLDDSNRLSSPAFQPLESGMEIAVAGETMQTSQAVKRIIRYETVIIDTHFKRYVKVFFGFLSSGFSILYNFLFGHFLTGNAVTKSVLSQHHNKRIQPFEDLIQIQPIQYVVAFHSNNTPVDAEAGTFASQARAMEYMQQQIQSDPSLADSLHVIPITEVNLAA